MQGPDQPEPASRLDQALRAFVEPDEMSPCLYWDS